MKMPLRELLTDLKAAILIGDPDSIDAAFQHIRASDDNDLPLSALVPLGEVIARLEPPYYLPLLGDDDAAIRGAAAAAAGIAWLHGAEIPKDALSFAADDPVAEVRAALAKALSRDEEKAAQLAKTWLAQEAENIVQTGLQLIGLLTQPAPNTFQQLAVLDAAPNHDVRAALVECLSSLASRGFQAEVLGLLHIWVGRPEPNVWVITKALSASWAKSRSPEALKILQILGEKVGEIRPVQRAIDRHDEK